MTRAGIIGLGLWLPEAVRKNDAWPASFVEAFRTRREERRKGDITDIQRVCDDRPYNELFVKYAHPFDDDPFKGTLERRVALPDVPTVYGDAEAARAALADARVDAKDIDLVMSSAVLQDKLVPSNGPGIADLLGCTNAAAIGVEAYCASAPAQLELAASLVAAGHARHVLCVQSHQINRINDLSMAISPVFGDASSALIVGAVREGAGLIKTARGGDPTLRNAVNHGFRDTPGATWWKDAAGPVFPAAMEDPVAGRTIAQNALAYPIDMMRQLAEGARVPLDALAVLAMIQPLPWYQEAVAAGLGLSPERVPSTYARIAHVGGAALVANLLHARAQGLLKDGAIVALYAHGAGVSRYAALLRWVERPR
jgi:3-oxoacyl-[acyl-carrier-protein] synthase-3